MELRNQTEDRYIDEGLIDDLKKRLGTNNILSWIDFEAERLAEIGLIKGTYVDFTRPLLDARNIRLLRKDTGTKDAYIKPAGEQQYEIVYQEGLPPNRRRFSIAHEIGHTYFFLPGGGAKPLSPFQNKIGADPTIENLCDQFAASLLLPRTLFHRAFERLSGNDSRTQVPLHILPKLGQLFGVAERAVAIRVYFDLPLRLDAVLCIRPKLSRNQPHLFGAIVQEQQWQVSWLALPKNINDRKLQSGTSIPLSRSGRTIPSEMVPRFPSEGTAILELDSRWWYGVNPHPHKVARVSFSKIRKDDKREALVGFCDGKMYIGLLGQQL